MTAIRKSFTKSFLASLKPKDAPYTVSDEGYRGYKGSLNAKVYPDGRVAVFVMWRVKTPDGKLKQRKTNVTDNVDLYLRGVGDGGGNTTIDALRQKAHEIALGSPSGRPEPSKNRTIAEVGAEYLQYRKESDPYRGEYTHQQVARAIERAAHVWGDKPLSDLTVLDAEQLLLYVIRVAGASSANSTRGYFPSILAHAKISDPAIDDTIFRQLRRRNKSLRKQLKVHARDTILTKDERPAFFAALKRLETGELVSRRRQSAQKADCIRLIYLTAARQSEWLKACWGHVDVEAREWVRPDENRKNGEHVMTLPGTAVPILQRIRERLKAEGESVAADALIFPGLKRCALRKALQAVKDDAGIESGLTLHDLRRSRVTQWAIEEERSEFAIAAAIGSKDVKTLIRHYMVDAADEAQRRARVEAVDDAELI